MSFYSFSTTYLLVIIILLTCRSLSSIPIRSQQSKDSFIQNHEEFIPTNDWQVVKEGQAVPPGLHIRLNLETGAREAKLLEDSKQKSSSNDLISLSTDDNNDNKQQKKISRKNLERAFTNLNLTKDDVITDKKHEEEIKSKYRTYDKLKKDFESINMKVQTDHEILKDLINQLNKTDNNDNRKTILTDLEFYLHQYDNAIRFADLNGLNLFMQLLNSTNINNDIRHLICLALGAAFQGNPQVQLKGLNLGFVQYLLRLLNIETNDNIQYRLIFTLSTLLRNFPQAQINFLQHGGIEMIIKIFDQSYHNNKIKIRLIELMNDLIIEKVQATDDKRHMYDNIHIRDQLVKHGWCSRISHYLTSLDLNNFGQIEKILKTMVLLEDVCRTEFISSLSILDKLYDIYINIKVNEDSTYIDIINNIDNLRKILQQTSSIDL